MLTILEMQYTVYSLFSPRGLIDLKHSKGGLLQMGTYKRGLHLIKNIFKKFHIFNMNILLFENREQYSYFLVYTSFSHRRTNKIEKLCSNR